MKRRARPSLRSATYTSSSSSRLTTLTMTASFWLPSTTGLRPAATSRGSTRVSSTTSDTCAKRGRRRVSGSARTGPRAVHPSRRVRTTRTTRGSDPRGHPPDLLPPEAADSVIVDHSRCLHERVTDRRPHEPKAARLQVPAQCPRGLGLGRHLPRRLPRALNRLAADKPPDVRVEAAVLPLHLEKRPRVRD